MGDIMGDIIVIFKAHIDVPRVLIKDSEGG